MQQVVRFPEPFATLFIRRSETWSDDAYWAFCMANSDAHVERKADGEVVIGPPLGGEAAYRVTIVSADLHRWAGDDGTGVGFGSSVQFFLPDGSGLSPRASWVSCESLNRLSKREKRKFLRLSPEFVVEVLSPTDNLKAAKAKMELWIANGVQLAWLIDGDAETVHVYRKGQPTRIRRHVREIAGDGPVAGFVLNLVPIWKGL